MRLSRTNMPLASSDSVISQLTYAAFLDNLALHLRAENPDHKLFCHSQPQNPPQLSKSGLASRALTAPASSFAPSDAKDEKGEPNASEKYGEVTDLELGPRGGFSKRRAEQRSAFRRQRRRIFLRTPSLPYWRSPVCCGSIAVAYPFSGI